MDRRMRRAADASGHTQRVSNDIDYESIRIEKPFDSYGGFCVSMSHDCQGAVTVREAREEAWHLIKTPI